jgi:hypothetical protein
MNVYLYFWQKFLYEKHTTIQRDSVFDCCGAGNFSAPQLRIPEFFWQECPAIEKNLSAGNALSNG